MVRSFDTGRSRLFQLRVSQWLFRPDPLHDRSRSRRRGIVKERQWPLDRLQRIMSPDQVAGVKADFARRHGGLAADVEAVDAEGHDRFGFWQFADPLIHPLGVPPDGTLHNLMRSGAVVPGARVYDL